ncbi:MAG: hypothetical protein IAE67_09530 [Candidatus Competibacteraceae bacterium]|nr:hypothetical protein [Candidatus Competibacteraceae bacterium]
MKTSRTLLLLAVVAISSFWMSCKKDTPIEEIITMSNAVLRQGNLPSNQGSNAPVINTVNHNSSFIAGGGSPIQVLAVAQTGSLSKIYLGLDGFAGYYEVSITQSPAFLNPLIAQSVTDDELTFLISVGDDQGNISETYTFTVTRINVGTGKLQVSLTFDQNTDLDLYLVEPDGETIYYGNSSSSSGGMLDLDSNPACWIDGVNNENITYDDQAEIEAGTYTVRVNNYADCVGTTVNYSVVVRYNGQIVPTSGNTNPYNGSFAGGTAVGGGQDAGQVIFTFSLSSGQVGTRTVPTSKASFKN